MKKIRLFLLMVAATVVSAGFTACSDDKESADSIVGRWLWSESNEVQYDIMTFTDDGRHIYEYVDGSHSETQYATYTYDGTLLTLVFEDGVDYIPAVVSGDTLILDGDEVYYRM